MKNLVLVATALLAAFPAHAQAKRRGSTGQCPTLVSRYVSDNDLAGRYLALSEALGDSQDLRMRSMVEQKQANALTRSDLDLRALKAAGCHAPVLTVSSEKYEPAARGCARNLIMSRYGGDAAGASCDPAAWPRER